MGSPSLLLVYAAFNHNNPIERSDFISKANYSNNYCNADFLVWPQYTRLADIGKIDAN
jgi:hypothetical protein